MKNRLVTCLSRTTRNQIILQQPFGSLTRPSKLKCSSINSQADIIEKKFFASRIESGTSECLQFDAEKVWGINFSWNSIKWHNLTWKNWKHGHCMSLMSWKIKQLNIAVSLIKNASRYLVPGKSQKVKSEIAFRTWIIYKISIDL